MSRADVETTRQPPDTGPDERASERDNKQTNKKQTLALLLSECCVLGNRVRVQSLTARPNLDADISASCTVQLFLCRAASG